MTSHRVRSTVIALAFGVVLALLAYERITDMQPRQQRREEEAAVLAARGILKAYIAPESALTIVDPLAKNRVAGKVFIYPVGDGWQVSGHYRRDGEVFWHPWLMTLNAGRELTLLKVQDGDPRLLARSLDDERFRAVPRGE